MAPSIAPGTTLGPVALTVADLARSIAYYERLGLEAGERSTGGVTLSAGPTPLLRLEEIPGAPPADGHTGLFHFALLVPERADLARWLARAAAEELPLTGASDHFVSEALYLRDPDHHGIEIYWDRPRELWEGQVQRMGSWPLDLDDVMTALDEPRSGAADGLPSGTVMGHVHLRVREVDEAVGFYRDVLGMDLMAHLGDQAAFLAAGGYHHHIGANTWESRGATPAPEGSATLRHLTIVLPGADERDRVLDRVGVHEDGPGGPMVADPSGNRLVLAVAA